MIRRLQSDDCVAATLTVGLILASITAGTFFVLKSGQQALASEVRLQCAPIIGSNQ